MTAICPHCGYNLAADAPYVRGLWHLDPQAGRATFGNRIIVTRASWVRVLHTLAAASPSIVKPDALLNRVSASEDLNTIRVIIAQIKRKWPVAVPWPIESVCGHGYRWVG